MGKLNAVNLRLEHRLPVRKIGLFMLSAPIGTQEISVPTKPIIFSRPMVKAILRGDKSQTRRIIKPQPEIIPVKSNSPYTLDGHGFTAQCPYTEGMRLWVRETWTGTWYDAYPNCVHIVYAADGSERFVYHVPDTYVLPKASQKVNNWVTPLFMPRWASRITLEITDIRVERLQQITEADALAEGIHKFHGLDIYGYDPKGTPGNMCADHARGAYVLLWDSINQRKHPWTSNPFVWAVSFRRVEGL